jgi:hypothetical protein
MRHTATQALYAYWNEVRRDRLAPRRLEIQPARIGDILLDTFILERTDPSGFRFRLAGTRVTARFGIDLKAQEFLSCWREADRSLLEHHLEAITELGRVGVFTGEGETRNGGARDVTATFELLVLPLVHTGENIDRLLCLMVPLDDERIPRPGSAAIRNLRLVAAEAVWPSGRAPELLAGACERQVPLAPHVRLARIVRQGRRQFRVYEGGLVAQAPDGERR